jgi:hypothetical protein
MHVVRIVGFTGMLVAAVALAAAVIAQESRTFRLHDGDDLQRAIDEAQPGDTIELEPGATFVGNFVLPVKDGAAFITIRSAYDRALPSDGMRIRPSDAPRLARLRSPNEWPAIRTAPGAHHWRLLLLAVGPNGTPAGDIVRLGDGSRDQRGVDAIPHHLEIDRCLIQGDAVIGQKRGIALNSAATRIANSHLSDLKLIGQDTQAIAGWNGPGPFVIENNYLEAAGVNVLFGGADPAVPGLVPADISFRANHVSKPIAWRGERWQVKNLLELKNAERTVIEDNLFEHNWQAAQSGAAILFTPRNQDGRAPWSVVRNVVFRRNVVRHVAAAINVLGIDSNHPSERTTEITLHQNLIAGVDSRLWGGNGVFLLIGDGPRHVVVDHNTVIQSGAAVSVYGAPTGGFVFSNNLVRDNGLGIKGDGRAPGLDSITAYLPGAIVTHNVFAEGNGKHIPPGNHHPSHAVWVAQFRDYQAGDYSLAPGSSYRGAGTDGRDIGVDADLLHPAFAALFGARP